MTNSKAGAGEQKAQEQRDEQFPPYVTVSTSPEALGAAVSAWIRRGYEVWGGPVGCEGQLTQALIRADVAPERRLMAGPSECSGSPSLPGVLPGAANEARGMRPRERGLKSPDDDILERDIEELGLKTRSFNCLRAHDIRTVKELVRLTTSQLLEMQNLGAKSLADIIGALGRFGYWPRG